MSKFAHIPWVVAIQIIGTALLYLSPIYLWPLIAGWAGWLALFVRECTQAEYRFIETHGGLRANMPDLEGLKFWRWNAHSKAETVWSGIAVIAVAAVAGGLIAGGVL